MSASNRSTVQRRLVLSAVKDSLHPTAVNVYDKVKKDCPGISLGTVYRNLNLLEDLGEIQKVTISGAADRFDRDLSAHHHVVCSICGSVEDVHGLDICDVHNQIERQSGYSVVQHSLCFSGICPDCQNKGHK